MLKVDRPLVFFDIETTGLTVGVDRVVQLGAHRWPDRAQFCELIRCGVPIPPEATEVHGITDAGVANAQTPLEVFSAFLDFIAGCDLAGYNSDKFDVPFLEADMQRHGLDLRVSERRRIDVMTLWRRLQPRTLQQAFRMHVDCDGFEGHDALSDAFATAAVMLSFVENYLDDEVTVEEVEVLMIPEGALDRAGKIVMGKSGQAELSFGKHQGLPLTQVPADYLDWCLSKDFPKDTRELLIAELRRRREAAPAPQGGTNGSEG